MSNINILWKGYKKRIIYIIFILCSFSIFGYIKWMGNGKSRYEIDNNEKESIIIKQLPDILKPYSFNKEQVMITKNGSTTTIYVIFKLKYDDFENRKKISNTVDKNSAKLGFEHNCRGEEMIITSNLDDYERDPTVTEIPLQRYAVIWQYPSYACIYQNQKHQ